MTFTTIEEVRQFLRDEIAVRKAVIAKNRAEMEHFYGTGLYESTVRALLPQSERCSAIAMFCEMLLSEIEPSSNP